MDYEKAYKEALNWMRGIYPTLTGSDKEDAEHYFPELAETEARGPEGKHYLHQVFNKESLFPSLDALCDFYINKFKKFKHKENEK